MINRNMNKYLNSYLSKIIGNYYEYIVDAFLIVNI